MISKVSSLIRSTVSAFLPDSTIRTSPDACAAHRVGPQRVIFTARQDGTDGNFKLASIYLGNPIRALANHKAGEESVVVCMEQTASPTEVVSRHEKRATLKVKADTRFLAVAFIDNAGMIHKSERISIK